MLLGTLLCVVGIDANLLTFTAVLGVFICLLFAVKEVRKQSFMFGVVVYMGLLGC